MIEDSQRIPLASCTPVKVHPHLLRWWIELHLEELCLGLPRMLQKLDCKAGQTESKPRFPDVETLSHGRLLTPRRQASFSSWGDDVGVSWPCRTAAVRLFILWWAVTRSCCPWTSRDAGSSPRSVHSFPVWLHSSLMSIVQVDLPAHPPREVLPGSSWGLCPVCPGLVWAQRAGHHCRGASWPSTGLHRGFTSSLCPWTAWVPNLCLVILALP